MDEATARDRATRYGWAIAEEVGHGWRRVVPSPEPLGIIELDASGTSWRTATRHGRRRGRDSGDARCCGRSADLFVISTNVQQVCLNVGKPDQRALDRVTVDEAKRYLAEGQFGAGSMAPKIQGIIRFLEAGGRRAIVTCPLDLEDAIAGQAGTEFVAM
jgi:carbamate kinase